MAAVVASEVVTRCISGALGGFFVSPILFTPACQLRSISDIKRLVRGLLRSAGFGGGGHGTLGDVWRQIRSRETPGVSFSVGSYGCAFTMFVFWFSFPPSLYNPSAAGFLTALSVVAWRGYFLKYTTFPESDY
jgi:hypothetical protein